MAQGMHTHEDGTKTVGSYSLDAAKIRPELRPGIDKDYFESLLQPLHENGYVIIENLVSKEAVEEIKEAMLPFMEYDGRNDFEGYKTRRMYSVIERSFACNPLIDHPLILALLDSVLMQNYLLSQMQAINVYPGEVRQPLHHDDSFYPIPRPRAPFGAATIWAIDDFTEDNGATMVIPKSHLWGERNPADIDPGELIPAVMPAGSVLFFYGTTMHCAGANNSGQPRMAVTAQYCEPWARQQENFSLSISRERAKLCSDEIQSMLGYSMLYPFIGFANGRDPKRLLK